MAVVEIERLFPIFDYVDNVLAPQKLPSLRQWRSFFLKRGLQKDLTEKYLSYIKPLVKSGVPVIFDTDHLAALLGRTPYFLSAATNSPKKFYRSFSIPKKSGGLRKIDAPYPSLKLCQKWVAEQIVSRLETSEAATAYKAGSSILNHAKRHLSRDSALLLMDLKDYFPTITKRRVIGFFESLGYNSEVSLALSELCCLEDRLPQGSPASPWISNVICKTLDKRILGLCRAFNCRYSRYADDLCISGENIPNKLQEMIATAISESGFIINPSKTRKAAPHSTEKIITGINVASGLPRISKKVRRELKQTMHFIGRYGYLSHAQKVKIKDQKFLLKLKGRLEYWKFVEPNSVEVKKYIEKISELQRLHEGV